MNQGTFSDYHTQFAQVNHWMFYGGDLGLNSSSMVGIFVDYARKNDSGTDDSHNFGSRISKN